MAIAFDNATVGGRITGGSSKTFSHVCSGTDRIIFVEASVVNPSGNKATAVTYDGVAMTKIDDSFAQHNVNISLWFLKNPSSGTNDVVVTFANAIGSFCDTIASSYNGASQSGSIDNSTKSNGTGATFSESLTPSVDNCWVIASAYHNGGNGLSLTSGGVERAEAPDATPQTLIVDTNSSIDPASIHTFSFSNSSDNWAIIMASFAPVEVTASSTPDLRLAFI